MRTLARNKQIFFWSPLVSKTETLDDYGNPTGEYVLHYGNPIRFFGNISASTGEIQANPFGGEPDYDRVIVLDDPKTPIDEYAIMWIEKAPSLSPNGSLLLSQDGQAVTPHNYIVKKVARSLNSVSIAVSRVNVT